MTERDGIIADAWNDYVTERDEIDVKVRVIIDLDLYITVDKHIIDEYDLRVKDKVLEILNDGYEFDESDVDIDDMYVV